MNNPLGSSRYANVGLYENNLVDPQNEPNIAPINQNNDLSQEIDEIYQKTFPFKKLQATGATATAASLVPPLKLKKELQKTPDIYG